ncbi:hypothetical protein ASE16_12955 [Leifsonia sp. Root227]|nr:hypothetical protein ASE16_12955 [Leifsonia sp. Root227]
MLLSALILVGVASAATLGVIGTAAPATAATSTPSAPSDSSAPDSQQASPDSQQHPQSALPQATPSSSPSDTTTPTSPPPTSGPPTIDQLPSGLVTRFPLAVSGSGTAGDVIHVSAGAASTAGARCDAPVNAQGDWTCSISTPPDGPGVTVRAESRDSGLSASSRVDVLSPPVIASQSGTLVSGGGVHGTAYPGATVTVRAENGSSCSFPADSAGTWGCVLSKPLPSGTHRITATQRAPFSSQSSGTSAPVAITVDTTPPAAPTIGSPAPGTEAPVGAPLAFSGAGENGAKVTVYGSDDNGSTVVCSAVVHGTSWTCSGRLGAGRFTVSALQRDAAGNVSGGSNAVAITVLTAAPSPSTSPESPSATPSPHSTPSPAAPVVPPGTTPSPTPFDPYNGNGSPGGTPDWLDTPFTSATAPVVSVEAFPGWLRSLLLAAAALLLLALPARLLAVTVARERDGREKRSRASIFGRNRSRAELRDADALYAGAGGSGARGGGAAGGASGTRGASGTGATGAGAAGALVAGENETAAPRSPWLIPTAFVAAAALVTLSSPVDDAGAYLRVILALAVALAAVNAVWVAVARWVSPHFGGGRVTLTFRPWMLVVVGVAAIASRLLGLQPALLFGLILGVAFAGAAGRVARGRVAAVQVAAVALLGVVAWLTVGALPQPTGVVSAFLRELANAVSLLGLGSAAIALLPIGGLAGRAVFQWSRGIWLGLGLVIYTLLFALLLPVASLVETGQGTLVVAIAVFAFAALSVCVWLWEKYVEPER